MQCSAPHSTVRYWYSSFNDKGYRARLKGEEDGRAKKNHTHAHANWPDHARSVPTWKIKVVGALFGGESEKEREKRKEKRMGKKGYVRKVICWNLGT